MMRKLIDWKLWSPGGRSGLDLTDSLFHNFQFARRLKQDDEKMKRILKPDIEKKTKRRKRGNKKRWEDKEWERNEGEDDEDRMSDLPIKELPSHNANKPKLKLKP